MTAGLWVILSICVVLLLDSSDPDGNTNRLYRESLADETPLHRAGGRGGTFHVEPAPRKQSESRQS
jgi:hypothetical protein